MAILDDSSPETDDDLIKVVLGGSGNFGDFWPDKSISVVATKNGLLGSQSEVSSKQGDQMRRFRTVGAILEGLGPPFESNRAQQFRLFIG